MAVNYTEIQSQNWALNIYKDGEVVTDLMDIQQSLLLIFNTRTESDPLRPDFGTEIWRWVDKPVNVAIPNVKLEILKGVQRWEPRAEILSISHELAVDQCTFTVRWRATLTGETVSTSFNVTLSA